MLDLYKIMESMLGMDHLPFRTNHPLIPEEIEPIVLNEKFFEDNKDLVLKDTFISEVIREGGTSYIVPPVKGSDYRIYINTLINNLMERKLLNQYTTVPLGLMLAPECFGMFVLDTVEDEQLAYTCTLPFELNTDYKYLVITVDESDDGSCEDDSFTSVSVLVNGVINKTYIRIAGEDNRWSDWLEFTDDVELNINYYSLYKEYEKKLTSG